MLPLPRSRFPLPENDFVPLRVVAVTACAPVAHYDPPHLDNLLAWSVVQRATEGAGVADSPDPYDIPLPLECLWRSPGSEGGEPAGLPLWAATVFTPVGESAPDTEYLHKRMPGGGWSRPEGRSEKLAMHGSRGRWMERRVPLPTVVADEWEAFCVGDARAVADLLESVSHLGKRRGAGLGAVHSWRIQCTGARATGASLLVRNGVLTRPVPAGALATLRVVADGPPRRIGWTPPQWKPTLWSDGYPAGSPARVAFSPAKGDPDPSDPSDIDWFAAVDGLGASAPSRALRG